MLRTLKNPWGQTVEAQRRDLWLLDLTDPIASLNRYAPRALNATVGVDARNYYRATTINLAPVKCKVDSVLTGDSKVAQPGEPEPYEAAQADFICESNSGQGSISRAQLDSLQQVISLWRNLPRAGMQPIPGRPTVVLPAGRWKPEFKFRVWIHLLSGDSAGELTQIQQSFPQTQQSFFQIRQSFLLDRCWIGQEQLSELDRSAAASPLKLTVKFYAHRIEPMTPRNARL